MTNVIAPEDLIVAGEAGEADVPVWLVEKDASLADLGLDETQQKWLAATGFKGAAKQIALVPGRSGELASVVFGLGEAGRSAEPSGPAELLVGQLAQALPAGTYRFAGTLKDAGLAAMAWGLGAYRFRRYKGTNNAKLVQLRAPAGVDAASVQSAVGAVWQGRDLINTPASDMGPAELEAAARTVAQDHGADISVITGDDLIANNFPLIHAVGRASTRAPRLIDFRWGREGAPTITLVGKGICFDTGGLDIKPAAGMLLMKKDMGGSAAVLTLARMIMGAKLDVRLRVLIPAAENSISGNAFRPGDVLTSRAGLTIEVGNTDAEGRLVLADALALADEEAPQGLMTFATLTGAARVALGPDLPAFFTTDDAFAADVVATSDSVGDPVWRLPFWPGYDNKIDNQTADISNTGDMPFAGAITAALFLKRFTKLAQRYSHFDIYGWRPAAAPLGPKGGEPQAARAVFAVLKKEFAR